jgi:hypothetical protein
MPRRRGGRQRPDTRRGGGAPGTRKIGGSVRHLGLGLEWLVVLEMEGPDLRC